MDTEKEQPRIASFNFDGKEQPVSFVETMKVIEGVECDVYTFSGDTSKDLGIIRITPGSHTPLQKVLKGDRTVEGYISGKGKLTITRESGEKRIYEVGGDNNEPIQVNVRVGELMQWEANPDNKLEVYEVCFPPYEDGRYENL